jgi:hypothetical protein
MTFRDIKRRARQTIHSRLAEPALYFADESAAPVPVTVRLHLRFDALGELLTVSAGFADRQELTPRIIFMNDQVTPAHNGIVVTRDLGAYNVGVELAPDDITTAAEVSKLSKSQILNFGWDPDALFCGFPAPVVG